MFVCTAPCSGGCNSENGGGTCIGPETCVCNDEWTGSNCETRKSTPWYLLYHNIYTELMQCDISTGNMYLKGTADNDNTITALQQICCCLQFYKCTA